MYKRQPLSRADLFKQASKQAEAAQATGLITRNEVISIINELHGSMLKDLDEVALNEFMKTLKGVLDERQRA